MEKLAIIGLGGGGYTAGIYGARYGLNPLLIGESDGGMIVENPVVENFSGYADPTSGYAIMDNMRKQAESFGTKIMQDRVTSITPIDPTDLKKGYNIQTTFNGNIQALSLILALGTEKVKLNAPGENTFFGKGVSYCATCDGFFYKGKTVIAVGGGDSAMIEALYLSDICEKVYLIHRRNSFRGEPIWMDRILKKPNIEIINPAVIKEIKGENKMSSVIVSQAIGVDSYDENAQIEDREIKADGLFVAIGTKPNHMPGLDEYLKRDEQDYIIVNSHQETNLPGVYAAGDCSTASAKFRQLIVACGEGAVAAEGTFKYISMM